MLGPFLGPPINWELGEDADKSSSPQARDGWISTDLVRMYICFIAGTWTEIGTPHGTITIWTGALADIPDGWALCDGSNGTPDLRDRFVKGSAAATDPGGTGGNLTHTHAAHSVTIFNAPVATVFYALPSASAAVHDTVNHEPPYYEVAYLMKL